ncbi:hypothetical protein D3C78_1533500 [compost metagenome]
MPHVHAELSKADVALGLEMGGDSGHRFPDHYQPHFQKLLAAALSARQAVANGWGCSMEAMPG